MPMPKDPEKYKLAIQHLSESHKGYHPTEETLAKMRVLVPWNKGLKGVCKPTYSYPKGHTPWIKGKHHKLESNEKNRLAHLGQRKSPQTEFKKGQTPWNKGKNGSYTHTEQSKKKLSISVGRSWIEERKKEQSKRYSGIGNPFYGKRHTEETQNKINQALRGRKATTEQRLKQSRSLHEYYKTHESKNKGKKQSQETIRKRMEKIGKLKQTTTLIERRTHQLLDELHIKYRKHYNVYHPLIGFHQVDIMILDHNDEPKIAIECDGCFWHGCKEHTKPIKTNELYWKSLITKTKARDRIIDSCMKDMKIKLLRMWEHDINTGKIPIELYSIGGGGT